MITKKAVEIKVDRIAIEESGASLKLSSVAYCNADSLQETKANEKVMWSTATNTNIKNAVRIPELTGYIKDMAWSYEKEIRIKAEFENIGNIKRVAIPLTDEVIDAMVQTGQLMSPLLKETSQGGLATTKCGILINRNLKDKYFREG